MTSRYLASKLGRLYELEVIIISPSSARGTKRALEEIRTYTLALFRGYTTLTPEQVEELPNLSKAKAIETIKEGVKMREQG